MWQSKYYMKVRGIDHFCSTLVCPYFFIDSLAAGTVAVTAGVIVKIRMTAFRTLADITSERTGLAVHDSA